MNLKLKAKILLGIMLLTPAFNLGGVASAKMNRESGGRVCAVIRPRDALADRRALDVMLCEAIHSEARERVRHLLSMGVNFSTFNAVERFNALQMACARGFANVVRAVLNAGERNLDVNAVDNDGKTLLHTAVLAHRREALDVVRVLIEHGADPNKANSMGITPFDIAVYMRDWGVANVLLEHGAIGNALNVRLAMETYEYPSISIVRDLLQQGADLKALDRDGLVNVLCMAAQVGDTDLVNSVLQVDRDIVNGYDLDGEVALHYAVEENHLAVVQALVRNGANVNAFSDDGYTAMYSASSDDVYQELVNNGADINAVDDRFGTVLHAVTYDRPSLECLERLLDKGANVNVKCPDNGDTPLHRLVLGVLEHPCPLDCMYKFAVTLLKRGADPTIVNDNGETPLAFAERLGNVAVVDILKKAIEEAKA